MTQNYTGMRKGISLLEMVVAIILFAALAVVSVKYTKQYLDTDIQAKRARIAALTEQANQLVQAHAIYKLQKGADASQITDLNGTGGVMVALPTTITEIGTVGWLENNATGITGHPISFEFNITDAVNDRTGEQYCALVNNEFNSSRSLIAADATVYLDATTTSTLLAYGVAAKPMFCYSSAAQTHTIAVLAY